MLSFLLAAAVLQNPLDTRLAKLAKDRMSFDRAIPAAHPNDTDYEHIYSMGAADQHIFGFYPLGKSNRRYLYGELGGEPEVLIYQAIRHGRPRTVWRLRLRPTKRKDPVKGTLASRLRFVCHAEPAGKLTVMEKQSLADTQPLAGYGYDGDSQAYAWILQSDGFERPVYLLPELNAEPKFFPILAEESVALGIGHRTWPPNLHLESGKNWGN